MSWVAIYLRSSIGKKQLMAVTGLLLCGFLLSHLTGNLLLLVSPEVFNTYAHTLTSNPLIYVAEVFLAVLFLSHIGLGLQLSVENRKARGQRYSLKRSSGGGETFASKTMIYSGLWIFIFLLIHLFHFRIAGIMSTQQVNYNGVEMIDLYGLVMEHFQSSGQTVYYLLSMVILGIHLGHGFSSALQSLGFHHPKYTPTIKTIGFFYSIGITVGFSTVAIFCHIKGGSL